MRRLPPYLCLLRGLGVGRWVSALPSRAPVPGAAALCLPDPSSSSFCVSFPQESPWYTGNPREHPCSLPEELTSRPPKDLRFLCHTTQSEPSLSQVNVGTQGPPPLQPEDRDAKSGVTVPLRLVWPGCSPGVRLGFSPGPLRNLERQGTGPAGLLAGPDLPRAAGLKSCRSLMPSVIGTGMSKGTLSLFLMLFASQAPSSSLAG